MTTTRVPSEAVVHPADSTSAESRLRRTLLANVALSVSTGVAAVVAGGPIADLLGVDQVWLIRLLGAGLLVFAAGVFLASRSRRDVLVSSALEVSIADLAWVVGTIVVITLGWLSTTGAIVMAVIGADVLLLGVLQLTFRRRMLATAT